MPLYRLARPAPAFWNIVKTLAAVALFSLVVLRFIPRLIVSLQRDGESNALIFPEQRIAGMIVFGVATVLVIWSALTLAIVGGGTPLPFDAPRRLVIAGPYARCRNPMVTGLVLQGVGVGLAAGSGMVILFFAVGALLWDVVIRPDDEHAMQKAFGRHFELYRRGVRCWFPMRRRWSPPPPTGPIFLDEVPERQPEKRRR